MSYIYPHNNPEILKLGIRMALYGEKKPDHRVVVEHDYLEPYSDTINKWQQSFIAYLKKPGWAIDDDAYHESKGHYKITGVNSDYLTVSSKYKTEIIFAKHLLSHYYPGQQVESFKYVREVKSEVFRKDILLETITEWQEVEEPTEYVEITSTDDHSISLPDLVKNVKYTQFQADIKKAKILAEI